MQNSEEWVEGSEVYLREIKERFDLPVLQFPLMQDEIRGLERLSGVLDFIR